VAEAIEAMTTTTAPVDFHHARDIPDEAFLDAIRTVVEVRWHGRSQYANRWDIAMILGGMDERFREWCEVSERDGFDAADGLMVFDVPGVPEKVVLAKAKRLMRRGLISGCACGCRGDFEVIA
jgi:hypothetical protein